MFNRRILRSNDWKPFRSNDFKRRITRSYWDKNALRGEGFKRRITRSTHGPQRLMKRQSLIPFPRTGKRSEGLANKEQNNIYFGYHMTFSGQLLILLELNTLHHQSCNQIRSNLKE